MRYWNSWIACCLVLGWSAGMVPAETIKAGDLTLNVPASWKRGDPSSGMRVAQFSIPRAGDDTEDGELVVFYFGPDQGGSVQDNLARWVAQFSEEGRKVEHEKGASANGPYHLITITGTYNKPMGPPIMRNTKPFPGSRMLGAVIQTVKGNYFLKCTGPDQTVLAAGADFRTFFGVQK